MAVHFAAGLNYAQRTAGGFLNPNAASTVMMWARFGTVQALPNYNLAYALLDDPAVYVDFVTIDASTGALQNIELTMTGAGANPSTNTPVTGQWYHLCWVQASGGAAGQLYYVNGTKIGATAFVDRHLWTIGFEMIGNDTFATSNIDLQYFRSWQAALTTEEIRTEMQSATAVKATPFMNTPLTANLNDISGNARNWTLVGADSFVAGPSFPANSTAATATVISGLPTSVTTDFQDGLYAWYTYVSVPADLAAGFYATAGVGDSLTALRYTGTSSALVLFNSDFDITDVPFIAPTAGGETWFFRIFSSPEQPTADVVIDAQLPPTLPTPIGSIAVNDDGNFVTDADIAPPATFLDGTTGATLRFALAAAGEAGMVYPLTGQVCLYDVLTGTIQIFPPELGTPTVTIDDTDFGGPLGIISSDQTSQFYVGTATAHVHTLSLAGVIGATDFALTIAGATELEAMAPTQDNTILYYANSGNGAAIRRWDLLTNTVLSDLAAGVANHRVVSDILCLADGTIVVGYDKPNVATDWFVRRYSAAGAILNTYTFGATNRVNRMAYAEDDPTSFWVWLYLDDDPGTTHGGGVSRFVNVNAADGAILHTVEADNWEAGVLRSGPAADPLRFGHSFSCPFWIQRVGVTPPGPGEPEEFIIRRERWFPVINQENQRMTFSMLQVDLQAGNGLTVGQGENPLLELDWSDDAGWTWSNIRFLPTGRIGQYNRRAIARVLGQSRQRVFRIAVSDPVQWVILDGYMQVKGGTS